jgi:hypothetical protein
VSGPLPVLVDPRLPVSGHPRELAQLVLLARQRWLLPAHLPDWARVVRSEPVLLPRLVAHPVSELPLVLVLVCLKANRRGLRRARARLLASAHQR